MKRVQKYAWIVPFASVVLLLLWTLPSRAISIANEVINVTYTMQILEDNFWVQLDDNGLLYAGGGSGYPNNYSTNTNSQEGVWFYYDDDPNGPWFNQWFYDHPYDPNRYKRIEISFTAQTFSVAGIDTLSSLPEPELNIVINWSTDQWSLNPPELIGSSPDPSQVPPLPNFVGSDELLYIGRSDPISWQQGIQVNFNYIIPDYNPEWISVDVWGRNVQILDGYIRHECIPEPATLLMLGGLGLGLAAAKRRLRK